MDGILRDFPDSFDTERLTIRSPRPGDGPEFNAAVHDSFEGIQSWLGHYPKGPPTVEESETFIRRAHARFLLREDLMLLLFLKDTHTLVGSSGLHSIDWHVPKFEIGYWGRTPYAGYGYITEAVNGISNFAFDVLGAKRIFIRCDADNTRSEAVARRADFEYEGSFRCDSRKASGELRDTLFFAKVRRD